ncbi:MAG: hypothetical protein ACE5K3_09590 [bacterium]
MRKVLQVIVIFLVLGFAILWIKTLLYPDRDKIKRLIQMEMRALEEEDVDRCMKGLAHEFRWQELRLNYFVARRALQKLFETFEDIKIKPTRLNIDVKSKDAAVKLEITATARNLTTGEKQGFYSEPGIIFLRKIAGKWKIVEVERGGTVKRDQSIEGRSARV